MAFPKIYIGNVGSEGTSTGPHIHQYVRNRATGKYLPPESLQAPLLGLRYGRDEVPMFIKNEQGQIILNPQTGATVTSEFGPRSAPTAGASTFHQGRDIAAPMGTQIKYVGPGAYTANKNVPGFGNLGIITTPDNKYDIGFGHMANLGTSMQSVDVPEKPLLSTPEKPTYDASQQRTQDLITAFMLGTKANTTKTETFEEQLKNNLLSRAFAKPDDQDMQQQLMAINSQLQSAING